MRPIVPLMLDAPLTSIVPDLVKPLPLTVYVTASSVTPGATSKFKPRVPACSSLPLPSGSLAQPMNGALTPSDNKQTKGN